MTDLPAQNTLRCCDNLTRRDFLRAGSLAAGATLTGVAGAKSADRRQDVNCILLFLVGGPSHLDTWDPKPAAPANIRGPFRPIQTNVTGIQIGEHFPRMAGRADRYALLRSVNHQAAPVHETGHQLMQTGHLFARGPAFPHYGAVLSHLRGSRRPGVPPFVVLPGPIGNTGVSVSHGQEAGFLGDRHQPVFPPAQRRSAGSQRVIDLGGERAALRERYGRHSFGRSCLLARRLVEHGVRFVTVNMFDTVFHRMTWDCHADGGVLGTTLNDYRDTLCPVFDRAYTALLDDLQERGLLDSTLVVAMGEFGRTPRLNPRGGRDHWPGVWTMVMAGGGVRGGQVIGASDRIGAEPRHRPVSPAEVAATIYQVLGIDRATRLPGPDGRTLPLVEAEPVSELFHG